MGKYLDMANAALREYDINDRNDQSPHGIPLAELRAIAGPDWPEVQADPALLETLAHAVGVRRMRERGEVPPHYTATTVCAGCGPVPIFEGAPERVMGCPWCFNRAAGRPLPRPPGTGGKLHEPRS